MPFCFDNTYARLPAAFTAAVEPTPVAKPVLVRLNQQLAAELGLDAERLDSPEGLGILAGNRVADGSEPLAMAYSGHQFGGFSPQLGDGRAILLGELISREGVRYDVQLKGAGPTPFSRRGDGRSALGPVLREYIVSEAMAALGVPTTRALAAVASGEQVLRGSFVPGGVFTRIAQSHIRIGTFQWFAARQDRDNLAVLANYTIDRHFPNARQAENPPLELLYHVIERQAKLIAHWMQIGFIHGVMNTDNMSVSGETIDYGPCAFMDAYHPGKTFSSIDRQGRYAFVNQASIGHWNLTRFAETLLTLIDQEPKTAIAKAEQALDTFASIHQTELQRRFREKIGIQSEHTEDWKMVMDLLKAMANSQADFTLVFRHLPDALESGGDRATLSLFEQPAQMTQWLSAWRQRHSRTNISQAVQLMRCVNPVVIPRNHRIEAAIQAGNAGDFTKFHQLVDVLRHPFSLRSETAEYENAPQPHEVVQETFCGT